MSLSWYVNRLRAMSAKEIVWRLRQKHLAYKERDYARHQRQVDSAIFNSRLSALRFTPTRLGLCFEKEGHTFSDSITLLGGYSYGEYKTKWHAGFQTDKEWERKFSYHLNYKQRDDIGDARTNWELNRHHQLAILAKNYYFSGDEQWAREFESLFDDWNHENSFLIGISWTSVMEVALRSISWMLSLCYLQQSGHHAELQRRLLNGIVNMTEYVVLHHSRFSSANNHLIVEAAAMALAGYGLDYQPWKEKALTILSAELPRQNHADGVNREMSLHYQLFVMEAYALVAHCMQANGDVAPQLWMRYMDAMCTFVGCSTGTSGEVMEFGDDDEGKIIDLDGDSRYHVDDVMQFCSLLLGKRHDPFGRRSETIRCLFGDGYWQSAQGMPLADHTTSHHFGEGGYTFLRSTDKKTLVGIDHAALGFGSIAAHGHADALSFQMMEAGEMLLTDPGTYLYHCDLASRNRFRQTLSHNTLCVAGRDQSEMLGPFLWGRKAHCHLLRCELGGATEVVEAEHDGYQPIVHKRRFTWDPHSKVLRIDDELSASESWVLTFVTGEGCTIEKTASGYRVVGRHSGCTLRLPDDSQADISTMEISTSYGMKKNSYVLRASGHSQSFSTTISIIS